MVRTKNGRIRADHVVLACGGYLQGLERRLSSAIVPIATFIMATEALGEKLNAAIRVPYAISDYQVATNYYRALPDTRLLWGGRVFAWERSADWIANALKRDMASIYPELKSARVEVAWGGLMPFTRHELPVIGQIEPGLWYVTGFGGLRLGINDICWPARRSCNCRRRRASAGVSMTASVCLLRRGSSVAFQHN